MEPTNQELATQIAQLKQAIENRPTKEDIEKIVLASLNGYFKQTGMTLRGVLVGTAVIVGALTVILGGFKTMLAWIGFNYISK